MKNANHTDDDNQTIHEDQKESRRIHEEELVPEPQATHAGIDQTAQGKLIHSIYLIEHACY